MKISGWGNFPKLDCQLHPISKYKDFDSLQTESNIARGLGRSYGDSSLADHIAVTDKFNYFLSFDETDGSLFCTAGVSLDNILKTFVPKGWFLPVTPGTKFVTVGGAIASDVHGKNHHLDGSFCDHVEELWLHIPNHGEIRCTPTENTELFRATCGGMGLTGFITKAKFKLIKISSSSIKQESIKTSSLEETLSVFEHYKASTYTVAWIDCLAKGKSLGRSHVIIGEHSNDGLLTPHSDGKLSIPINFPTFALNPMSVKAFNELYYHRQYKKESKTEVHYDPYFYPLDGIHQWNRIYGKNGFCQYQFAIPYSAGANGLREILSEISKSNLGSFLAVLKVFGKGNDNLLSFPMEGYTLALDFKYSKKAMDVMNRLDHLVLQMNGRLYLTKDSRMPEEVFKASYPRWIELDTIRQKYQIKGIIQSAQSKRLGL